MAYSSKKGHLSYKDVPAEWIYSHYLKLDIKDVMSGHHRMQSVFKAGDKTPSMYLFRGKEGSYNFKCFSTGYGGNAIELVKKLFDIDYDIAIKLIVEEYRLYLSTATEFKWYTLGGKAPETWKLVDYNIRADWKKQDVEFWSKYNIGSELLKLHNVKPLYSFTTGKGSSFQTTSDGLIYGYFTLKGELYKIYQPYKPMAKFLKVRDHLQGLDQITLNNKLFICSSLKDIMSLKSIFSEIDCIAPNSESELIDDYIKLVNSYSEKYIIFDNDKAGLNAMLKYKAQYDIPILHLKMGKDISDSVKDYGAKRVAQEVKRLMNI